MWSAIIADGKYFVKWHSYGEEENSWESAENFDPELLKDYHALGEAHIR